MLKSSKLGSKKKKKRKNKAAILPDIVDRESFQIVNFIGYAILSFTLLDYILILIPPQLLNPLWEFQTIGRFVETAWAPLLGLMLIFYRRQKDRMAIGELKLLFIVSRATLFIAIAYFLAVPLLMSNTFRISSRQSSTANQQISLQTSKVQDFESKINEQSDAQLEKLMNNYSQRQETSNIDSTQEFKAKMLEELKSQEQANKRRVQKILKTERNAIYKNAFKWIFGAIITGVSFLFIWNSTKWVRVLRKKFKLDRQ